MTEASTPDGALLSELKWVHSMIRTNLQACREGASLADSEQADRVRGEDRVWRYALGDGHETAAHQHPHLATSAVPADRSRAPLGFRPMPGSPPR